MKRLLFVAISAALASGCGGGGSGGSPTQGPAPSPAPAPTATPTPAPAPSPTPTSARIDYLHVFGIAEADGRQPNGPLIQATDGNFYGTTRAGGTNFCQVTGLGCGTVVRITPAGSEIVLKDFGAFSGDGKTPNGPLLQGRDGALYGVTAYGGDHDRGAVYRLTLDGSYSVLYSFKGYPSEGATPTGRLAQGPDGTLYGATSNGGTVDCSNFPQAGGVSCGTVFKLASDGSGAVLHSFGANAGDGLTPNGSLLLASDGFLYGTTVNGGANSCSTSGGTNNCGTLFRIGTDGSYRVIRSLGMGRADPVAPQGELIEGADGLLYGTSVTGGMGSCGDPFGCGTVFRSTKAGELTVIYAFGGSGLTDGSGVSSHIIFGTDGNIYGTTGSGGANGASLAGTAFRLTPAGVKTTLYSFGPLNDFPHNPQGGVIQGGDGALYGVVFYNGLQGAVGARFGQGAVYRLMP